MIAPEGFLPWLCGADLSWEAGILPLNYARIRGLVLHVVNELHWNSYGSRVGGMLHHAWDSIIGAGRGNPPAWRIGELEGTFFRGPAWYASCYALEKSAPPQGPARDGREAVDRGPSAEAVADHVNGRFGSAGCLPL